MSDSLDNHEQFIGLLTRHEPVIRASIRAVVRRPEDVAEIMQAVSIVAWRKFDSLTDADGFGRWACVIARYEILKFQRGKARDRLQLDEDLAQEIVEEAAEETTLRSRRIALLETCLNRLPDRRRQLVLQAYDPARSMKTLAAETGHTPDGLYQLLRRIRLELMRCVEQRIAAEGGTNA